jgi:hypothetical protein
MINQINIMKLAAQAKLACEHTPFGRKNRRRTLEVASAPVQDKPICQKI